MAIAPTSKLPTTKSIIQHLKLLKCFNVLLARNNYNGFLVLSVKRFLIFMNAVMYWINDNDFLSKFNLMLPPIDVCMVWYCFILDTQLFTYHMKKNNLDGFFCIPFPLERISNEISSHTYLFDPKETLIDAFERFIQPCFSSRLSYNAYLPFDDYEYDTIISCPTCNNVLATFVSDPGENITDAFPQGAFGPCFCAFGKISCLDDLKKRALWKELTGNFMTYFSSVEELSTIFESLKSMSLDLFIQNFDSPRLHSLGLDMQYYAKMNPMVLYIPGNQFKMEDNLVQKIKDQALFMKNIDQMDWITSCDAEEIITDAIARYEKFLKVVSVADKFQVNADLDIDLVWHTHQLDQQDYHNYTKAQLGQVLRHHSQTDIAGFDFTARKYYQLFKERYALCFCGTCCYRRLKSRSLFIKKPRQFKLFTNTLKCKNQSLELHYHQIQVRLSRSQSNLAAISCNNLFEPGPRT